MTEPTTEELVERLNEADTAIGGVTIHLIKTGAGIEVAKAVVNLKAAAQNVSQRLSDLEGKLGEARKENDELRQSRSYQRERVKHARLARNHIAGGVEHWKARAEAAEAGLGEARKVFERIAELKAQSAAPSTIAWIAAFHSKTMIARLKATVAHPSVRHDEPQSAGGREPSRLWTVLRPDGFWFGDTSDRARADGWARDCGGSAHPYIQNPPIDG